MLGDILAARGEGNYLKYLQKLTKVNLLIIDDFGLNSLTDTDKKDLMEIIEDRYMTGSTIIASQLPIKDWHAFIGDPTIADAVCDRLFHVAHKFELKGDSMRKKLENIDWCRQGVLFDLSAVFSRQQGAFFPGITCRFQRILQHGSQWNLDTVGLEKKDTKYISRHRKKRRNQEED